MIIYWVGISGITATPPVPAQIQDISIPDHLDLALMWSCIKTTPPGYVWLGEVIDGELVESPEPVLT
jgi:hypothetical protein